MFGVLRKPITIFSMKKDTLSCLMRHRRTKRTSLNSILTLASMLNLEGCAHQLMTVITASALSVKNQF
jgi:hypothetical protein